MHAAKMVFRPAKSAEEERRLLEDCIQKLTRDSTKRAYKMFNDWQIGRGNKDASLESCSFTLDMAKIQRLDTNIVNMSAESLNLWLEKFIQRKRAKISGDKTLQYGVISSCLFNNCTIKIFQLKIRLTVLFGHYVVVKID